MHHVMFLTIITRQQWLKAGQNPQKEAVAFLGRRHAFLPLIFFFKWAKRFLENIASVLWKQMV